MPTAPTDAAAAPDATVQEPLRATTPCTNGHHMVWFGNYTAAVCANCPKTWWLPC